MAPIKVYLMPESPPCRTVLYVLKLIKVEHEIHHVNLFAKENKSDDYTKINPVQKVPFIVDGDLKLGESRAIVSYLINKYMPADNTLYPSDPAKRAKVDELLYYDIGSIYATSSKLLYPLIFAPVDALDKEAEANFRNVLSQLEQKLNSNGGKKFLLGDDLTIGDASVLATLSFVQACDYDLSEFKSLTGYLQRVKDSIPDANEIHDKPVDNMRQFIKSVQAKK